ncbi:MAG: hypothetical protein ABJL67_13375, partial [Sulfitobacter sp.]
MFDLNWRAIAIRSYTAWAFYVLAFITVAPDIIYLTVQIDTNPAVWSSLQIWVIILGLAGRLVLQPRENARRRALIVLAIVVGTVLFGVQAMAQTTERQTMRIL